MDKRRHKQITLQPSTVDRDERFVLRLSAIYLQRLLGRYPHVNSEMVKFLAWILGDQMEQITEFLEAHLEGEDTEELRRDLDAADDLDDVARAVMNALGGNKRLAPRFVREVRRILALRTRRLGCHGRSELERVLRRLRRMLDLTDKEAEYCFFVYLVNAWPQLEAYFDSHLQCNNTSGRKYLSTALDLSAQGMARILGGKVPRLGIIDTSRHWNNIADDFLPLFSAPVENLFAQGLFRRAPRSGVPLERQLVDPAHVQQVRALLARRPEAHGTHLLLYGPPGVGKTCFARSAARGLGAPVFEVLQGEDNLRVTQRTALLACINMTNQGAGSVIIVDEADNLLGTHGGWGLFLGARDSADKGWLNHLLDRPGLRMIWICNQVEGIDASVRRRFAFSLAFRPLGRKQRLEIWRSVARTHRVRRLLRPPELERLAREYEVSAGAVDVAVRSAKQAAGQDGRAAFVRTLTRGLEAHCALLNDGQRVSRKERVAERFVPEAVNADCDLELLLRRLEAVDRRLRARAGVSAGSGAGGDRGACTGAGARPAGINLLFAGPPGTGKSELARYIAHRLDRTPLVRRASDLLDKYVGGTEQKLAQAFDQAERDDAVLILDEVDSLLFGRELAQRSWEVSATNELLTQMERFAGILICTTNRPEGLDAASLRRFQVKLRLGVLTRAGRVALYERLLAPLAAGKAGRTVLLEIEALDGLTAGDFGVVRSVAALEEEVTHGALVRALAEELRAREARGGRRAGFGVGVGSDAWTL